MLYLVDFRKRRCTPKYNSFTNHKISFISLSLRIILIVYNLIAGDVSSQGRYKHLQNHFSVQ